MFNTAVAFIEQHWGVLLTVSGVAGSLIWLKLDIRYAKRNDINQLRDGQEKIARRMDRVEEDLKHLPSADDVTNLRLAVEEMKGETRTLHASIKGLSRLVDLLVEKEVKDT